MAKSIIARKKSRSHIWKFWFYVFHRPDRWLGSWVNWAIIKVILNYDGPWFWTSTISLYHSACLHMVANPEAISLLMYLSLNLRPSGVYLLGRTAKSVVLGFKTIFIRSTTAGGSLASLSLSMPLNSISRFFSVPFPTFHSPFYWISRTALCI